MTLSEWIAAAQELLSDTEIDSYRPEWKNEEILEACSHVIDRIWRERKRFDDRLVEDYSEMSRSADLLVALSVELARRLRVAG